jgi:L1 cell adhesion molecule like protein
MSENIILGIDFGTTNSCISYYQNDQTYVIPNSYGHHITPSCLYFDLDSPNILYGNAAYNLLNSRFNHLYLSNIINNFKRLIGITYNNYVNSQLLDFFKNKSTNVIQDPLSTFCSIEFVYNGKQTSFTIIEITSIYLQFLKKEAEDYLGFSIQDIVITVPVYFSDIQRQHLQHACQLAKLSILRIINEPTSAALAYSFNCQHQDQEHILVIDCGGGTTDLSLLYMDYNEMLFEVLNVHGDNFSGGEDLTNSMVNYVIKKFDIQSPTSKQLDIIKTQCELAKCELSFKNNVNIIFENLIHNKDITLNYSRTQFYNHNITFFYNIKKHIIDTIDEYTINKIVFIGGTTRIPIFKEMCKEIFGQNISIYDSLNPLHTVSIGASIQGALLNDQVQDDMLNETLLLDIVPISLGLETEYGIMTHIVSKNTPLPVTKTQMFTNSEDFIDHIQIDIYQGERKFVKDNVLLSSFRLENLDKSLKRGEMEIKVTFDINKDGIITVTAKEKNNNSVIVHEINHILITPNIDDNDIHKIQDTQNVNLLLAKMELYNSYQNLLNIFHTKGNIKDHEKLYKLDKLFSKVFNIITNYQDYSLEELKNNKTEFENVWHQIMFLN